MFATVRDSNAPAALEVDSVDVTPFPNVSNSFEGFSSWSTSAWTTNGSATFANGSLVVAGAKSAPPKYHVAGRSLEFHANLSGGSNQDIGWGQTLATGQKRAVFSTDTGGALYANSDGTKVQLPASLLGTMHHYRIDWKADGYTFNVLSEPSIAPITIPSVNGETMRPVISDNNTTADTIVVDSLEVLPLVGTYHSRVFGGAAGTQWNDISWDATTPANTNVEMLVRTGNTSTPDSSWTSWNTVAQSGDSIGVSAKYAQYQAVFESSEEYAFPSLESVSFGADVPEADYFVATKNGISQNIPPGNVPTKLSFTNEDADPKNSYDAGNSELRATSDNQVWLVGLASSPEIGPGEYSGYVYKNGVLERQLSNHVNAGLYTSAVGSVLVQLDEGDVIDFRVSAAAATYTAAADHNNHIWGVRVDNLPHFLVEDSSSQNVAANSVSKIDYDNEVIDTNGAFDLASDSLSTNNNEEVWLVGASAATAQDAGRWGINLHKNSVLERVLDRRSPAGVSSTGVGSSLVSVTTNGAIDSRASTTTATSTTSDPTTNYMWGVRVDAVPHFIAQHTTSQPVAPNSQTANHGALLTYNIETRDTTSHFDGPAGTLTASASNQPWLYGNAFTAAGDPGEMNSVAVEDGAFSRRMGSRHPAGALNTTSGMGISTLNAGSVVTFESSVLNPNVLTTTNGAENYVWGLQLLPID